MVGFVEKERVLREPVIHSHITDCLPLNHPMANKPVYCALCKLMFHAFNNECMLTWVETGQGSFCLDCFYKSLGDDDALFVMGEKWAITRDEVDG